MKAILASLALLAGDDDDDDMPLLPQPASAVTTAVRPAASREAAAGRRRLTPATRFAGNRLSRNTGVSFPEGRAVISSSSRERLDERQAAGSQLAGPPAPA